MRIVISDRAGVERIALRGIHFYARQYQAVGTLTSTKIDNLSLGFVQFMAAQEVTSELTNITHQISYDGVHFSGIAPGDQFDLGGKPFWYRAYLERLDSNFETKSAPLPTPGKDPAAADYYRLGTMSAIDLGNNILERTITLDLLSQTAISARILALREVPLPGTLNVYQGAALLGPQEYTFLNNALSFAGNDERLRLVIRYQTSVFANAGLVARREYYTPRLFQVSFEMGGGIRPILRIERGGLVSKYENSDRFTIQNHVCRRFFEKFLTSSQLSGTLFSTCVPRHSEPFAFTTKAELESHKVMNELGKVVIGTRCVARLLY